MNLLTLIYYLQTLKNKRDEQIKTLREQGITKIGDLEERELFLSGVSLYWAEGFKKDNQMGFSNSDPEMIRFFILWLERCCDISKERLRLRVGINEQFKEVVNEIQEFWSTTLKIPLNQFQKPFFQKVMWKKTYDNPERYHGVLRVRVSRSSELLRMMYGWIEGLKKQKLSNS